MKAKNKVDSHETPICYTLASLLFPPAKWFWIWWNNATFHILPSSLRDITSGLFGRDKFKLKKRFVCVFKWIYHTNHAEYYWTRNIFLANKPHYKFVTKTMMKTSESEIYLSHNHVINLSHKPRWKIMNQKHTFV